MDSKSYEQVAAAIAYIYEHRLEQQQLDLDAIATHAQLSKRHFQQLFTQWAGVSPEHFLQYVTVEYAKANIDKTRSLMARTPEAGLSGLERSPDLLVSLEAMSPDEYQTGGAGLRIFWGIHQTPFGRCLIARTASGICNLHFLSNADESPQQTMERYLRAEWPNADLVLDLDETRETGDSLTGRLCQRIFTPTTPALPTQKARPLVIHVKGTDFQIQVWRALLRIPFGGYMTYKGLAELIDRPTAARAVGTAVGRNSIGYLVPCHRVIRASGELGGYRWGETRKWAMAGWETGHLKFE